MPLWHRPAHFWHRSTSMSVKCHKTWPRQSTSSDIPRSTAQPTGITTAGPPRCAETSMRPTASSTVYITGTPLRETRGSPLGRHRTRPTRRRQLRAGTSLHQQRHKLTHPAVDELCVRTLHHSRDVFGRQPRVHRHQPLLDRRHQCLLTHSRHGVSVSHDTWPVNR